jgi:2-methylcitrate dehydratase
VYLHTFDEARFTDPALLALTAKVRVNLDDKLTAGYPAGIPNRLTVTLTDGRKLVKEVAFPRGHAKNPMTDAEVEAKFRAVADKRYGRERADAILKRCWDLENLTSVTDLIRLFDA